MAESKRTPEDIVSILQSIKKIELGEDDGKIHVWQLDDDFPSLKTSFGHGSFTRLLVEFLEDYLNS